MRILLSAFVCQPGAGSEEGVGWGTAWSLAQNHRVHVLTRPFHRVAIERHLAQHPCAQLSFSYHDFGSTVLRFVVTSALWQLYYHAWQLRIAAWASGMVERFDPDVVHHITYGRYWTPSSLWKLGRPFVWGPLGGGDACPPEFRSCLSVSEKLGALARNCAQRVAHWDPSLRATARHTAVAIASTSATERRLRSLGCTRVVQLLQMALDPEFVQARATCSDRGEVIFCSVGRLLGWKGHALTLRAFAQAAVPGATLVFIGAGPAKCRLQALAKRLHVGASVRFLGNIAREETLRWIERSTALVHSSFHDQAPTVVFEAMAAGTPVIALGLGGLVSQVTPATGLLIKAHNLKQASGDMAVAIRYLARHPGRRAEFAAAAAQRVQCEFTWKRKAEQFTAIYTDVMNQSCVKRAAGAPFEKRTQNIRCTASRVQDG